MELLLKYLDESGWTKTEAATRRIEKDGWVYDWQAGAWSDLWRWKPGETGFCDIDTFVIRDEQRAIEIARNIANGDHLLSPPLSSPLPQSDWNSQKRIAFIE